MLDGGLRELERSARARPEDAEAGWAYARALGRAGERRAQYDEVCRLARAGDGDAARAIDRWVPWAHQDGAGDAHRSRRRGPTLASSVRQSFVPSAGGGVRVLSASDGIAVVARPRFPATLGEPRRLTAIALDELAERWSIEGTWDDVAARGDQVFLADDATWTLIETGTGASIARVRAPSVEDAVPVSDLVVGIGRDRHRRRVGVAGFDLGARCARRWLERTDRPVVGIHAPGGGRVVLARDDGAVEALAVATGRRLFATAPAPLRTVIAADDRGVIVRRRYLMTPSGFTHDGLDELDASSGETRWSFEGPTWLSDERVAVADGAVVAVAETTERHVVLLAIDRASGETTWDVPLATTDDRVVTLLRHTRRRLVVTDDACYLAVLRARERRVDVSAFGLQDGRHLFSSRIDLAASLPTDRAATGGRPTAIPLRRAGLDLIPTDGALLLLVGLEPGVVIARLAAC